VRLIPPDPGGPFANLRRVGGSSLERVPNGGPATAAGVVCPRFHEAVELVGRRWTGAILFSLIDGPLYFRELLAAVPGVSDRLLSQRLRELEAEGLVERSVHEGPPARVSYRLTASGEALEPVLLQLHDWAQTRGANGTARH
jgi:DNA-binding HxlR family transcriptional regulator